MGTRSKQLLPGGVAKHSVRPPLRTDFRPWWKDVASLRTKEVPVVDSNWLWPWIWLMVGLVTVGLVLAVCL